MEGGVRPPRLASSVPPRSTWKTSAPIWPRFCVDQGPTIISVRSNTRMPSKGPKICNLPRQRSHRQSKFREDRSSRKRLQVFAIRLSRCYVSSNLLRQLDSGGDMSARELADKTAVVGIGTTDFGALYRDRDPERTPFDMGADAFVAALDDAGLTKDDIDGVLVCGVPDYGRMCDILGIRHPRFVNVMQAGGRQSASRCSSPRWRSTPASRTRLPASTATSAGQPAIAGAVAKVARRPRA